MDVPVFIEAWSGTHEAQLQICRKIVALLCRSGITPLPFANSIDDVVAIIHSLRKNKQAPAIFVVNSYWAEQILLDLDAVVGETPILLLHRMLSKPAGLVSNTDTLLGLHEVSSRKIAVVSYGAKTADSIASHVSSALIRYIQSQDWLEITRLNTLPTEN